MATCCVPSCWCSAAMDRSIRRCRSMKERERELLLAVARGHSSATIAALHQVRSDSVRRSLSALYRKVGVKDQRGLIAWGLEQGLLRPPDLLPPPRATVHQASRPVSRWAMSSGPLRGPIWACPISRRDGSRVAMASPTKT